MARSQPQVVRDWLALPAQLQAAVRGRSAAALDARATPDSLTLRETVHHVVESNLVASGILLAALATDGGTYDWTWVWPNGEWMKRMGYGRAPVAPAIACLRALGRHFAVLLAANADGLQRKVQLFDKPGAPKYSKTVEQVLAFEVQHAREHLAEVTRRKPRPAPALAKPARNRTISRRT